jgi:hypothetical protein
MGNGGTRDGEKNNQGNSVEKKVTRRKTTKLHGFTT